MNEGAGHHRPARLPHPPAADALRRPEATGSHRRRSGDAPRVHRIRRADLYARPTDRRQVMETIQRLNVEESLTVVLITQSMDEAVAAGRVLVMHAGGIVMDGPPEEDL